MIEYEKFPYKIIKKEGCGIKDEESLETDWYMEVNLYTISNGSKLGMAYDKYDWCSTKKEEYVVIIDCNWEHIDILDTELGAYIIAYAGCKCCCYSLFGTYDYKNTFISILATDICGCVYDSIKYAREKNEKILLLHNEEKMQYYDMKKEEMSDVYDWIHPIDNEFIECCEKNYINRVNINNDVCFPEILQQEIVRFACRYKDGSVYHILTNRNCEENQWEGYLIFYSKEEKSFYITEVYDQINIYGFAEKCGMFYMSGFESLKNGENILSMAFDKIWADTDIHTMLAHQLKNK